MSLVKGRPTVPVNTPLRIKVLYSQPYQGGASGRGAGLNAYEGTWDWTNNRWNLIGGTTELDIPLPRPNSDDVAVGGPIRAQIAATIGGKTVNFPYNVTPHETDPGEVNITLDPQPAAVLASLELRNLLSTVQDAAAQVGEAAAIAARGQSVIDTLQDEAEGVSAVAAQLVVALEEVEAATAAVNAGGGLTGATTYAAIPMADGFYRVLSGTEAGQVYQRSGNALTRRPDLEAITLANLPYLDARRNGVFPTSTATANVTGLQSLIDNAPNGSTVKVPPGTYQMNAALYVNKNDFTLDLTGVTLAYQDTASLASIILHGAGLVRGTSAANWGMHLVSIRWADMVPCRNVRVLGGKITSTGSALVGNQILFVDTTDCTVDGTEVINTNGAAIEMRYSTRPTLRNHRLINYKTYGMFFYQCYKGLAEHFYIKNGGRAWEIKQQFKGHESVSHTIRDFLVEDCTGFPAPGDSATLPGGVVIAPNPYWVTTGVAFDDLSNGAYAAPIPAERNFPGHEKTVDVLVADGIFRVTAGASADVVQPALLTGSYASSVRWRNITVEGQMRRSDYPVYAIGNSDVTLAKQRNAAYAAGTLAAGLNTAYFGGNITVEGGYITGVYGDDLIVYVIEGEVTGLKVDKSRVRQIVQQTEPASSLPRDVVNYFKVFGLELDIELMLSSVGTGGIYTTTLTQNFYSGRNTMTLKPVDYVQANGTILTTYQTAQAYSIGSGNAVFGDGDNITITGNAAATQFSAAYAIYCRATSGRLSGATVTLEAPTAAYGLLYAPPATSGGLSLGVNTFTLTAVPSGTATALRLDGELKGFAQPTLSGGWKANLLDNTGLNRQYGGRDLWYAAMPTTGTFTTGDVVKNSAPTLSGGKIIMAWKRLTTGSSHVLDTDWAAQTVTVGTSSTPSITYGTAAPTTGTHVVGEIVFRNGSYNLGSNVGWVCYVAGTPGTWAMFGQAGVRTIAVTPTFNALFIGEEVFDSSAQKWYKAVSVGNGAADWKQDSFSLTVSTTLTPGAIAANSSYESADIAVPGVVLGDHILCDQQAVPDVGIIARAHVRATGQVRIRLYNVTAAAITPTAGATWKLTAIRASS